MNRREENVSSSSSDSHSAVNFSRDIILNHDGEEYDEYQDKPKYEYQEEPLQLIDFTSNGFKVNPHALEMINSIEEDLVVVAVIGKARTGKSYLMNLLLDLAGKDQRFKVDSKISSCTKGVWSWGGPRKSLTGSNTKILFIDSEGTSATDRGTKTYDSRIFALIVLISSLFLYNTTSNIDEQGISELSLAAHLSKSITTDSNIDKDALLTELAPKFIWVLRDFSLLKTHPETGQEISSKEYLEICLRKKTSKKSKDHNLIRDNIIKYFPDRDCVTLPRPVENESDLQRLDRIPFEKLKSNFKIEFKQLKDKIYKETLPKKFQGKRLNGPTLAHLIVQFVDAINSGAIPNINNSWDSVIQKDIKDYYEKAMLAYKYKTSKMNDQIYEQEEIIKYLYDYKLESFMIYNKLIQLNSDTFSNPSYLNQFHDNRKKLEAEINKLEEKIAQNNIEKTTDLCKTTLKVEYKDINTKMFDMYYTMKLVNEFNEDFTNFLLNYQQSDKCKGSNKLKVLAEFLIQNEKSILEYFTKIVSKESVDKLMKVDKEYRELKFLLDDIESKNKHSEEINETYENRIKNLEKDISKQERDQENLKERLENLEKELELLKQSEEQGISYQPDDKKKKGIMEDYNDDRKNPIKGKDGKKKQNCGCNCIIY